jgi:hypothetical protein
MGPSYLGGFAGHRSRATRTEILQPLPGEEKNVLLGQEVGTAEGGDGTQGPLQVAGGKLVPRRCSLSMAAKPTWAASLKSSLGPGMGGTQQPQHRAALTLPKCSRAASHQLGDSPCYLTHPFAHPTRCMFICMHTHSLSCPHHLLTLAGLAQLAEEQLQHGLTVEQATPVRGRGHVGGMAMAHPLLSQRVGRTKQAHVGGSLFDEVLGLLAAQEGTWPLGHSCHQA